MKHFFLTAIAAVIFSAFTFTARTQNITKLGDHALYNNTSSGIFNVGIGYYSLFANTTGNKNTGIGSNTLHFNVTGNYNTAGGYAALYKNTSGSENVGYGLYSLFANTSGFQNTALGTYSLQANQTGAANTAVGYNALFSNNGPQNTSIGYNSLRANTTGGNNTATGTQALTGNTTGYGNTANGTYSLMQNTTGSSNTATGYYTLTLNSSFGNSAFGTQALYGNTTGYQNTASGLLSMQSNKTGGNNTASGCISLYTNNSGSQNTAMGYASLPSNTTGSYNTASGANTLLTNTTGFNNTAYGNYALATNQTGAHNTAVGDSADVASSGLVNATALGYKAIVDRSNKVRVGNTSVTSIGGQVGWTIFSDGRYKTNVSENVPGLTFINSLRPVTYTLNVKGLNDYYNKDRKITDADEIANKAGLSKEVNTANIALRQATDKAEADASKITYSGFVAQEVESAAKKLNFDFSGVDKPESNDGLYGLRYDNFVVPLVKAVQELSQQNTELKKEIAELRSLVLAGNHPGSLSVALSDASFDQNVPNPFGNATTIHYNLPDQYSAAKIIVTDKNGSTIKEVALTGKGAGSLQLNSSVLSSGSYNYSLVVDGKMIGTRQMLKITQ